MSVNVVNKSTGTTIKIAGTSQGEVGNLELLDTEDKSCLVNAINEIGGG